MVREVPIILLFMIRASTISRMMEIRAKLIMPATSIDLSIMNLGARCGRMIWLIDVVIGVNFEDSLRSGRLCSNMVALKLVEKLKCDVTLMRLREYLLWSCFWSMHLIDHAPELMLQGKLHERLYAPGLNVMYLGGWPEHLVMSCEPQVVKTYSLMSILLTSGWGMCLDILTLHDEANEG